MADFVRLCGVCLRALTGWESCSGVTREGRQRCEEGCRHVETACLREIEHRSTPLGRCRMRRVPTAFRSSPDQISRKHWGFGLKIGRVCPSSAELRSMFLNRRSERPHAVLGPLTGCWRGLSGTPLGATSALEEASWAGPTKSTPTVARRRVVSPFAGFGETVASDPLSEIDGSSAIAAAWWCSNSTGGMSPRELCSRSWLNHATHWTVASSSCACERQTWSEISSVL